MQNNIAMRLGIHLFSVVFSMPFPPPPPIVLTPGFCRYLPKGITNELPWLVKEVLALSTTHMHDRILGSPCPPCWCLASLLSQSTPSLKEATLKPASERLLPSYIAQCFLLGAEWKMPPFQNCSSPSCFAGMLHSIRSTRHGNNISCQQYC